MCGSSTIYRCSFMCCHFYIIMAPINTHIQMMNSPISNIYLIIWMLVAALNGRLLYFFGVYSYSECDFFLGVYSYSECDFHRKCESFLTSLYIFKSILARVKSIGDGCRILLAMYRYYFWLAFI